MNLKDVKILVVEDEKGIRENLVNNVNKMGVKETRKSSYSNEAINIIEDFKPNIILLDLNIPEFIDGTPDISNAFKIMEKVQLLNNTQLSKIKIIVISGTIFDNAIQKIITLTDKIILKYVDKSLLAESPDNFKKELKQSIINASDEKDNICHIDYKYIREGVLKELKAVDKELWNYINDKIIIALDDFYVGKTNEFESSKNIIGNCGEIIETIIARFYKTPLTDIQRIKLKKESKTFKKLIILSGRSLIHGNNYDKSGEPFITRASAKYASLAFEMRNEAVHGKEISNGRNNKLFEYSQPTIEDAILAIDLIVPLIKDYVKYLKSKNKEQKKYYGKR